VKIFGRTKAIEADIDALLDAVSEQGMTLTQRLEAKLDQGELPGEIDEEFVDRLVGYKRTVSGLRRRIETSLIREMLIPDLRGEVMSLIERLHDFTEDVSHLVRSVSLIRPRIPEFLVQDLRGIGRALGSCAEQMVMAARAFFRNPHAVHDHVHKVGFHESESDSLTNQAIRKLFDSDLELAEKVLLYQMITALDGLCDGAESIADAITIAAMKREE